jgi:hypothetical protein
MYLNCFYANANEERREDEHSELLNVNAMQRGLTPLYLACRKDNLQIARVLLEDYGADPNVLCFERTPLFVAVMKFNVPMIEL